MRPKLKKRVEGPLASADVQPEHVVLAEIAARVGDDLENLGELQGVLIVIDNQVACNEDHDTLVRRARLAVRLHDLVLDSLERQRGEFLDDVLGALELLALEGQHGRGAVQWTQASPVLIEHLVIVLDKLLSDLIEIGHGDPRRSLGPPPPKSKTDAKVLVRVSTLA